MSKICYMCSKSLNNSKTTTHKGELICEDCVLKLKNSTALKTIRSRELKEIGKSKVTLEMIRLKEIEEGGTSDIIQEVFESGGKLSKNNKTIFIKNVLEKLIILVVLALIIGVFFLIGSKKSNKVTSPTELREMIIENMGKDINHDDLTNEINYLNLAHYGNDVIFSFIELLDHDELNPDIKNVLIKKIYSRASIIKLASLNSEQIVVVLDNADNLRDYTARILFNNYLQSNYSVSKIKPLLSYYNMINNNKFTDCKIATALLLKDLFYGNDNYMPDDAEDLEKFANSFISFQRKYPAIFEEESNIYEACVQLDSLISESQCELYVMSDFPTNYQVSQAKAKYQNEYDKYVLARREYDNYLRSLPHYKTSKEEYKLDELLRKSNSAHNDYTKSLNNYNRMRELNTEYSEKLKKNKVIRMNNEIAKKEVYIGIENDLLDQFNEILAFIKDINMDL